MLRPHGQAPTWLYSFVDLAFLMLIAFSQVEIDASARKLGELEVPEIAAETSRALPDDSHERIVVRVHPPIESPGAPFSLIPARAQPDDESGGRNEAPRLDAGRLSQQLAALHDRNAAKPLLAPHESSLTRDMLVAVDAVNALWPSTARTTTIAPVSALR